MRYISKFEKFINEQLAPRTVVVKKGEDKILKAEFPKQKVGDKFPNRIPKGGSIESLYKSEEVKKNIENLKPQIEQFMKENPEQIKFQLIISAGESQISNPEEFKTPGSLALARANAVKDYVNEVFADLIKGGKLTIVSPKDEKEVKIGETGYKGLSPEKRSKNAEAYKKEQFVDIDLKGVGQKTIKGKDITKTYCGQKVDSYAGGEETPENGFVKRQVVKLGPGEGKITFSVSPQDKPNIIYVEYNGKTYGDSTIKEGDNYPSEDFRVGIGTAMLYAFGTNDKIPPAWGKNNKFRELNPDNPQDYEKILNGILTLAPWDGLMWGMTSTISDKSENWSDHINDSEYGLWGAFYPIFAQSKSKSQNPEIVNAMLKFDKKYQKRANSDSAGDKKRAERFAKDLIEDLKPLGMKWGILDSKMLPKGKFLIDIDKIDGVDELTVISCATQGDSRFKAEIICK
jgi:hypothetical protein